MDNKELIKVIDFIEGYYHRKLEASEIKATKEELKDIKSYEEFIENFKQPLLARVQYFNVVQLHKLIKEREQTLKFLRDAGVKSWEELYDN